MMSFQNTSNRIELVEMMCTISRKRSHFPPFFFYPSLRLFRTPWSKLFHRWIYQYWFSSFQGPITLAKFIDDGEILIHTSLFDHIVTKAAQKLKAVRSFGVSNYDLWRVGFIKWINHGFLDQPLNSLSLLKFNSRLAG